MLSESEEQRPGAGAPISLSTVTQKGIYLYVGISIVAMFHNPQSPQGCQNDVFFLLLHPKLLMSKIWLLPRTKKGHTVLYSLEWNISPNNMHCNYLYGKYKR